MIDELKKELIKYRELLTESEGLPVYTQVEYILTGIMEKRDFPRGSDFLSEEEITEILNISRPTANRALKNLSEKGYLTRKRGKRAVINREEKLPLVFLDELISFGSMTEAQGWKEETRLLQRETVSNRPDIARMLGLDETEPLIHLKRIRSVEGEPVLIVDSYLSRKGYTPLETLPEQRFSSSLMELLKEHCGVTIHSTQREVSSSRMDIEDAALLKTTMWEPCLTLKAISYDNKRQAVEYFYSRLKGSRCTLKGRLTI